MQFRLRNSKQVCKNCTRFDGDVIPFNEGYGICRFKRFKHRAEIRVDPFQECDEE